MIDRYGDRFLSEGGVGSGNFGHAGRPGNTGGSAPGVVSRVNSAIHAEGGITVSLHGEVPTHGYAVAGITDHAGAKVEQVFARDVTPKDIAGYMREHAAQLREPSAFLGAWVDSGKTYLDVSQVFSDRSAALAAARGRDEIAVLDLAKFESVYTMTDQKRPSESSAKFTEAAAFSKKMHLIFGKDQTPEQIAATINAARNAQK